MIKDTVTYDCETIRIDTDLYDVIYGMGWKDPVRAFNDAARQISTEQYSMHGRFRGWKHEWIASEKEYFKRKLMGK